jgi:hypothetical protein
LAESDILVSSTCEAAIATGEKAMQTTEPLPKE